MKILFPHDEPRAFQKPLMDKFYKAFHEKNNLIVHAPTGSGKTAASIAPALTYLLDHERENLTIFFLTSRHTQHEIVIETLQKIKQKHDLKVFLVPIIGKKWMCAVDGIEALRSDEFADYCKSMREDDKCEFFLNTRSNGQASIRARQACDFLQTSTPITTKKTVQYCKEEKLCPYEVSLITAKKAQVIVCDYNYIFNEKIRNNFLAKIEKHLDSAIIIIDEGHNLPARIRESQTTKLSSVIIARARNEAKKYKLEELSFLIVGIHDVLKELSGGMQHGDEKLVVKTKFEELINRIMPYDELLTQLELAAVAIREEQKKSSIGTIAKFLEFWQNSYEGFSKVLSLKSSYKGDFIILSNRCLDPSIATKEVITDAHSTILMSGTLTPTSMYKDLLGFPSGTIEEELPSPFPDENKLTLILPKTSTKYAKRSPQMFNDIAKICAKITNEINGCSAIFFPSYYLRDQINEYLNAYSKKTVFLEQKGFSKDEKKELIERFKTYKERGAILLGVAAGSFGEGVDLPGILKCVIVVGIPLDRPDLETKELIKYYEDKFGRGWDYGYILPALTRTLQNAGRCIRTENDRGVLVFLDERYSWPSYIRCFPNDWNLKISLEYVEKIKSFFDLKLS